MTTVIGAGAGSARSTGEPARPALPLRLLAGLGPLLATAVLAGCGGGSGDEAAVRTNVEKYFAALAQRDFPDACARVSPAFESALAAWSRRAFPELASRDCEVIARRIARGSGDRLVGLQDQVRVRSAQVEGDRATARLGPGQTASLRKIGDEWLIERLDFSGATGRP